MTPLMTYLVFFIAVVVVAGIAVGIYFAVKEDDESSSPAPEPPAPEPPAPEPPAPEPPYVDINWVAVGGTDGGYGNIKYSADGLCWKETTTGASFINRGYGIAYGTSDGTNPLWVAVGNDGTGAPGRGNIMYSADGKEWQETTVGASFINRGYGIAYGTSDGTNPLWVAVGNDGTGAPGRGNIMYSADGKEWQETTAGASFIDGNGIAYGTSDGTNPLWVAVGRSALNGRDNIMYSENGKEWQISTGVSLFAPNNNTKVAYGTSNGTSPIWVATNEDYSPYLLFSEDGKNWQLPTNSENFSTVGINAVAYGTSNGTSPLWAATGLEYTYYSEDGKNWQTKSLPSFTTTTLDEVAYGTSNGTPLWVAIGRDGSGSATKISTNGKDWQETTNQGIFPFISNGVAYKSILPNIPNFY